MLLMLFLKMVISTISTGLYLHHPTTPPPQPRNLHCNLHHNQLPTILKIQHLCFKDAMLSLHDKEACGAPILGSFVTYLAIELRKTIPNRAFKADMEFALVVDKVNPGVKPASDAAVVAITSKSTRKPILLYEYKPVVDMRIDHVSSHHIMEVLIQAYYCLYQRKVPTFLHSYTV